MTTLPSMIGAPWRPNAVLVGMATTEGQRAPMDRADERDSDHRRGAGAEHGTEWVSCAACGMDVRADRLAQHRATQH